MTVQEFFAELPGKADPAKTAGMHNTYVFDVEGVGQWTVAVDDGTVTRHRGRRRGGLHDLRERGDARQDRVRRGEPDDRVHDRQAEDPGRHGRRAEAPEAVLVSRRPRFRHEASLRPHSRIVLPGERCAPRPVRQSISLWELDRAWSGSSGSRHLGDQRPRARRRRLGVRQLRDRALVARDLGRARFSALANAFLRPIVKLLALPLIMVTLGVAYFFVSMLMLLVTEWISPDLRIDGFWTYVGATIVVGLVNWLASAVASPCSAPLRRS